MASTILAPGTAPTSTFDCHLGARPAPTGRFAGRARAGVSALALAALAAPMGIVHADEAAAEAAADEPAVPMLETITVVGRAQTLYRVEETSVGKLATDPLLSSQSVAVISDDLIEDQGARDAQDIYRNISGVSFFSYAGVTARGFRQEEIFFDGLRGDPYAGFSVPQLFNVQRVEFLKGPAGMLYGPGAPGGLFNYVTKRPSREFAGNFAFVAGTEDRRGASLEVTGAPVGEEGPGTRLGIFYEDRDTPRYNAANETLIADGGLDFDLGFADLILQVTRYDQELPANRLRGVPVDDAGNFLANRRWNHNEPTDFLNLESTAYQAKLEGFAGESVTWDVGVRVNDSVETQQYHEPLGLFPRRDLAGNFIDAAGSIVATADEAEVVMAREYRDQRRDLDSVSAGANLVWSTEIAGLPNRLLVGADYYTEDFVLIYDRARGNSVARPAGAPNPLGLLNPVYGQSDSSTYVLTSPFGDRSFDTKRAGAYLLNELTIDRLILTGGLRHDEFEDETLQVFDDGRQVAGSADDDAVTYRFGAVYRISDGISAFVQAADSFVPADVGSVDRNGELLDPSEGRILEAGLKFALNDGGLQASASIYEIKRTNLPQTDADPAAPPNALVAVGEVTSRGFEADVAVDLTPNWVLTAAYAYNDARITRDNGTGGFSNAVGERFANAPQNQFGFWTRYQLPALRLAFALGGEYVDVQRSLSGQVVQPFTVFDASIIWEPAPYKVLLRVDNLADEEYAVSGFIARTGHFPGEPRSVFLEVSRSF